MYFVYRLFMKNVGGGAGSFEATHNMTKLKLARAAPGVFFALFGAAILIVALTRSFDFTNGSLHVVEHDAPTHIEPEAPPRVN
jgi:hypothetical protein